MQIKRTAILLFGYPAGQQLEVPDAAWYHQYFFNTEFGQADYWLKQTSYNVLLDGQVFDWVWFDDPNPVLTNRYGAINSAITIMQENFNVNFESFDIVILVLGLPSTVASDGGSTTGHSDERQHHGIVCRTGDRFDFVAHEIGHGLGLQHSFGAATYKNSPWSLPGEYGHPFCIMSAMGYGGYESALMPLDPRDQREEYRGLGPSLNGATVFARGWLHAIEYHLAGAHPMDFVIRSRFWGGIDPNLAAQAINVISADGKNNYVIEYRENGGWDPAVGSTLIINHGRGSTADLAKPNTSSATFLKNIPVPINLGHPGSNLNGPGFGIVLLDRSVANHTLTIRISPGTAPFTKYESASKVDIVEGVSLESGVTVFKPGEVYCVAEGIWKYQKMSNKQVAVIEATYPLAFPPITASWQVDGQILSHPNGTIALPGKPTHFVDARLNVIYNIQAVELRYEIVAIANGSRLLLYNRPDDQSFEVSVISTLTTNIGSGSAMETVLFEGIKYEYPQVFYDKRNYCMFHVDTSKFPEYKVLITPDIRHKIPEERFLEVEKILEKLSYLRSERDEVKYKQLFSVLENMTRITPSDLKVISLNQNLIG